MELVKSLGATTVIDYTKEDFTKGEETYDIIFDAVGKISFSEAKKALSKNGTFLEAGIGMGIIPQVLWSSVFGKKKAKIAATGLRPPKERTKDLILLSTLLKENKIIPVIDRSYNLDQIIAAHTYVEKGHKKGNVVIKVGNATD